VDTELDLEADWALVRRKAEAPVPAPTPSTTKVADDLEASWRALKNLPDRFYHVIQGQVTDGFVGIQLWEMSCHGQRKVKRNGRHIDCWIVRYERCLWRGPEARQPDITKDPTKTWRVPKKELFEDIGGAIAKIEGLRDQFIRRMDHETRRLEEEVRRQKQHLERARASLAWASKLDVGGKIPEAARARFLSMITATQRSFLGLLQARAEDLQRNGVKEEDEDFP